jgi:hypothetical protein
MRARRHRMRAGSTSCAVRIGDDLGEEIAVGKPRRIVSLPSLTDAVAWIDAAVLVSATDYCTLPTGLDVPRVGCRKNPSADAVFALAPDRVLAYVEESRESNVAAPHGHGLV